MLATKRRAVSVMNSDVRPYLCRNPESMIKIGIFLKIMKKDSFKNTGKMKIAPLKLGKKYRLVVKRRKRDWENFSREELTNGQKLREEWTEIRLKCLRNALTFWYE